MTDEYLSPTFDDPLDYDLERAKLARRRKIAEGLISTEADAPRMMGNWVLNTGPMGGVAAAIARGRGEYDQRQIDDQNKLLSANETRDRNRIVGELGAADTGKDGRQQRFGLYGQGMGIPSLRKTLEAQMGAELKAPIAEELLDSKLAGAQAVADARNEAMLRGIDARIAGQKELKAMPTIHITNSGNGRGKPPIGYRWNEDGTELEAIPGGPKDPSKAPAKPLSPAQEKAALELGSMRSNLRMLTDTFKDEYSGDVRASLERGIGQAAGGLAPKSTQDMTRWWADQAMFDELPQRHELFGATLTAGEKQSWNAAAINPNLSPAKIRERLATRAKIYDAAEARMKASIEAGGKSGKQFDAAVGKPKPQAVAAGTKGMHKGKPVVMGQDGEWHYEN